MGALHHGYISYVLIQVTTRYGIAEFCNKCHCLTHIDQISGAQCSANCNPVEGSDVAKDEVDRDDEYKCRSWICLDR